jgi:predicted ATPase
MGVVEPRQGTPAGPASAGAEAPISRRWRRAEFPMLDRESERRAVDDMLDLVRQGFSGALVLRGGHGVGKTTLVEYAITAATGFQVCEVVGVESEVELEFAAVHQLIMPFLPLVDDLPVPQRQAINIAFGIETGKPPDPFLVALGCLTLMSRAAQAQPALCVVDDAQWIDAESAVVLGFVIASA